MKNNYLIYSQSKEVTKLLLKNLISKIDEYDLIKYDNEKTTTIGDIIEEASMSSMFSPKKVIVVENESIFKDDIKDMDKLLTYLNRPNPNSYLIFLYDKTPDKRKKIYKYFSEKDCIITEDNYDLTKYINDILKKENYKMNNYDIKYLISKVGSNPSDIYNEINKLMLLKLNDKVITKSDIDKITSNNFEDNIFSFTNSVLNKDIEKSLKLYKEFIKHGYDEVMLIPILASQFRSLYQVKRLANLGKTNEEISKILGFTNPNRVKMCLRNAYSYTENELLNRLHNLAELDIKIKRGAVSKKNAFELYLIKQDMI